MPAIAPSSRITTYSPVSPQAAFPVGFPIFDDGDVVLLHNGVQKAMNVTSTYVDGISTDAVCVVSPGIVGDVVVVGQRTPRRTDQYINGAPLPIQDHNFSLNRLTIESQEARRDIERSWKVALGEDGGSVTRGDAGQTLVFDAGGNLIPGPDQDDITDAIGQAQAFAGAAEGFKNTAATSAGQAMGFRNGAQAAQTAAETARDQAVSISNFNSGATLSPYNTRAAAVAASVPSGVQFIRTGGYAAVGDFGEALYRRVGFDPGHAGQFNSADGARWELVEKDPRPEQFGLPATGNQDAAFTALETYAKGRRIDLRGRTYTVAAVPRQNNYSNGNFTVSGLTRSSLMFDEMEKVAPVFRHNGGSQLALLRSALSNPLKQIVGLALVGDSITWGIGDEAASGASPNDGTLSDARNVMASSCWANELKRYIGERYGKGVAPVLSNWFASSAGQSTAEYKFTETVYPRYGDFTLTSNGSDISISELFNTAYAADAQLQLADGSAGTSYFEISFPFTGTTFTAVYGSTGAGCLDFELIVDGISQGTFPTKAGLNGNVAGNGNTTVLSFGYIRNKIVKLRTKRRAGESGVQVLYLEAIRVPRVLRITNQGISGNSSYTYRNFCMEPAFGDGVAIGPQDEFILVQLGTNDRIKRTDIPWNVTFFKTKYSLLIDDFVALGNVILMAPPKALNEAAGTYSFSMREVRAVVQDVARAKSLNCIDNYAPFDREDLNQVLSDGLHPNRRGYAVMARNIIGALEAA